MEWALYLPILAVYGLLILYVLNLILSHLFSEALGPSFWSGMAAGLRAFVRMYKMEESSVINDLKGNQSHWADGSPRW